MIKKRLLESAIMVEITITPWCLKISDQLSINIFRQSLVILNIKLCKWLNNLLKNR